MAPALNRFPLSRMAPRRKAWPGAVILAATLMGCASHPTVAYRTLEEGESLYGYTLSLENVFPVLFYRYGLTPFSDIGFRVGVPIYGTGIDYSRVLFEKNGKRDVLNLGWSLSPNSNFDFTYYKFSQKTSGSQNARYWGLRGMFIPRGLNGGRSVRLGLLFGLVRKGRMGYEVGYFHDYASMPITQVFNPSFDYADTSRWGDRFLQFPHVSEGGLPTEHSRLTGLSVRVTFLLGPRKKETSSPPGES
ncbi:MAG: hypothetical protein ACE5LH_04580 [Fidelibacterota bacterium]